MDTSRDAVARRYGEHLTDRDLLALTDERGRRIIVPANLVAYVEIAQADGRRVGFGSS